MSVALWPSLTPADLLAAALALPALPEPPQPLPAGSTCALTGQPLTAGYPVAALVTDATAEFLDTFRGQVVGYCSEPAARCFRSANPRTGNPCARSHLAFADGTYHGPLIARDSAAAQGRPCWSALVRAVWPARAGEPCLAILTTDTKKRLWPFARVGALGARTPLLVYDSATACNEVRLLDWPRLLGVLDAVEAAYAHGFSKTALRGGLYGDWRAATALGLVATRALEHALRPLRPLPEYAVAVLIAQRPADYAPPVAPPRAASRPPPAAGPSQMELF